MENQDKSRISRRHLLESAGVVAGAGVASRITPASAAPQSTTPFFQRNQDTTKLTFWGQFPELLDPFKAVMADFNAAHPEVEIEVEMTTNDQYKPKIQSALNVGSGPDLYMVPAQPEMNNYVNAGTLVDVTDSVDLSQVVDVAVDAVTIDGKVWASPSGRYTVGICYHKDLFEEAGITEEPATWEEFRAVMQQLLDAGITPYSIAAKDGSLTYFNYIGLASSVLGDGRFRASPLGRKEAHRSRYGRRHSGDARLGAVLSKELPRNPVRGSQGALCNRQDRHDGLRLRRSLGLLRNRSGSPTWLLLLAGR